MQTDRNEKKRPEAVGQQRRILIGGVGYRWQRDGSFGLLAADRLAELAWPDGVAVEDLGYGAIYAAQDIGAADPPYDQLILLAAVERGRTPGQMYWQQWENPFPTENELQERIREAGAGVIHIDHLLAVGEYFGTLPNNVVQVEVEPVDTRGGEKLSPAVRRLLAVASERIRREVYVSLGQTDHSGFFSFGSERGGRL